MHQQEPEPDDLTYLTRLELASRWRCSCETIKRKQRAGVLHPLYLSQRKLLYRLSEVQAIEEAAAGGAK
jgi:hypothetical protein